MKCSPFSRSFRKGAKQHMDRNCGRFMKHAMRRFNDGYSSSSSSSNDECPRNQQSDNDKQNNIGHHGMKWKHDLGMEHGRKHSHNMRHRMRHGHGMMHRMRHGHGMMHRMRHGHGMMHRMRHGMMHERRHDHNMMHGIKHDMMHKMRRGHGMMHEERHGHGMKHWHHKNHGAHGLEHRRKHHHGMKHKMHHGHGRKHGHGHGPGMYHKLRHEHETCCPGNQNEELPIEVDAEIENEVDPDIENESRESDAITFYKPKTNAHVSNENNKFQISLETSYYQPEEVSVKIVDGKIDVSAMHESMEDNIYEFHEMYRSFDVPSNVNPEGITARLDESGNLFIEAVDNDQEESSQNERDVPVIRVSE